MRVTEHAILRYAERAMGLNLDDVRKAILTKELYAFSKAFKCGECPIGHDLMAVVEHGTVITVRPADGKHRHKQK